MPATDLIRGVEIGTELLGNIVGTIAGLVDKYGADEPRVQGITASLYSLLGDESASEVAQRVEREIAIKAAAQAAEVPAAPVPAAAPVVP